MNLAPIALFVYNRPSHTQRTIDALRGNKLARESDLFIFSDAARDEVAKPRVDAVREIIAAIDGFKSVRIVLRDRNWGLAASVIDGVTMLCRDYGQVIVLEDDLVVAPGFLQYMNQALETYEDEPAVMQISGYMFPVETKQDTDAFFLPFTTSWGWATWQRAWKDFDKEASHYSQLKDDAALRRSFDLDGAYPYFRMLQAQFEGKVDSWAIRWYLTVFFKKGLTLYPRQTLVSNTGFDGSGTHGGSSHGEAFGLFTGAITRFPQGIVCDEERSKKVYLYLLTINGSGLMYRVRQVCRKFWSDRP
jgi:GT2 family glycosyltransferase